MPNLHESVSYCDGNCDQIVAVMELITCANDDCPNHICPDCRVPTTDPDLFACSHRCAALANEQMAEDEAVLTVK